MNSSSSSSLSSPTTTLTSQEQEELAYAFELYKKDRNKIQQDISRLGFMGTLAGFIIGKSGTDAFWSGRVPSDYPSSASYPSTFRIPRMFGQRNIRIPLSTMIGIVGGLIGSIVSVLYINEQSKFTELLDRQYLQDNYGATDEQLNTLSIYSAPPPPILSNKSSRVLSTSASTSTKLQ